MYNKNWNTKLLGDCLLYITRGVAPNYVSSSSIAVLNQKSIRWGFIQKEYLKYHRPEIHVREEVFIRKGDIVVNSTGDITIGRAYYFKREWPNLFADSHVTILRLNQDILLPEFLTYLFPTPEYQTKIYGLVTGATGQLELSKTNLQKLEVDIPPLPTQRKIAAILSAYDDLIENNTRRIRILEEMAQTLYRHWFVDYQFPGHKDVRLVESELGLVPEGWEIKIIGSLIDFHINGGWGEEEYSDVFPVPAFVIRGTDIPGGRFGQFEKIPYRYHKSLNYEARKLKFGDIVIEIAGGSKGQPVGRALLISEHTLEKLKRQVICASFCKLLRPNHQLISSEYIYLHLLEIYGNGVIEKYQTQSTGIINFKSSYFLDNHPIIVPNKSILKKFTESVQPLFEYIGCLGSKNTNLRETRDLLLPKLISGELDVSELEIAGTVDTVHE